MWHEKSKSDTEATVLSCFFFYHTHDFDLEVLRLKFEIALSQELEGWLTWSERNVRWPFMAMAMTLG